MWVRPRRQLAGLPRTIAFDSPGLGRIADTSPVVLPHPALAAMIAASIDALDVDRCDVVLLLRSAAWSPTARAPGAGPGASHRARRESCAGASSLRRSRDGLISLRSATTRRHVLEQPISLLDTVSSDRDPRRGGSQPSLGCDHPRH